MPTDTVSIAKFVAANRITMTAERTDSNPSMPSSQNMDHWKCQLRMGRKRLTVPFSMGYGHNGAAPTVTSVLDCLASDASSFENASSFEDWAADYGYEADSRTAERTYKTIEHQAKRLKSFLGDDLFDTLLWNTERE